MKQKLWIHWMIGLTLTGFLSFCPQPAPAQPGGNPFQQFFQNQNRTSNGQVTVPRVVTVADEYSNSLIISAPPEQWIILTNLLAELDKPADEISELRVFKLQFADPDETAEIISGLFPDPTSQQNSRGRIQFGRFTRGTTTTQSTRALAQSRVLAVPDPRTGSVIVSAAPALMDQIEQMVARLDSDPARKQKVFVIPVENTDPTLAAETLRGLFEGQTARTRGTASRTTTSQQQIGGQLSTRATQNQMQGTFNSGFNSSSFGSRTMGNQ